MYKKYQASGSFRNLVRPALASGFMPTGVGEDMLAEKSQSFNLNKAKKEQSEKKKCCG